MSEYTAEDFIVDEDGVVIVSRDGWVKRQKEMKGGVAYTSRIAEIPASTGYAEPIQRFFKLKTARRSSAR